MRRENKWYKLGELSTLKGVQTGPFGSQLKSKEYTSSGVAVVMPQDIINGRVVSKKIVYISESKAEELSKHKLVKGDLVFSRRGDLRKIAVIDKEGSYICGTGCLRVRLKDGFCSTYLHHYTLLDNVGKWLEKNAIGQTMLNLNSSIIKSLPILTPPLPEQKAIADVLSTWDQAIEKTQQLIKAKEKQLASLGVKLFSKNGRVEKKGWKLVKLAEVLNEHKEKSSGLEDVFSVSVHKGLINQIEHLGRSFSAANTDHYNKVKHGDIVYTKSPTGEFLQGAVKQSYVEEDVITSPLYGVFTPRNFHLGVILDFYFSSPQRAKNYLFPIIQKGAKNTIAITNATFVSKSLFLPQDEDEQKIISDAIETSRGEIALLNKLTSQYQTQKRGLMQRLLTGEWRVNN